MINYVNYELWPVNVQLDVARAANNGEMQMRAEAVLFDKDGTLFDFQRTWGRFAAGFIRQVADNDTQVAAELSAIMGFDLAAERFLPESRFIASTSREVAGLLVPYFPGRNADQVAEELNAATAAVTQVPVLPLDEYFEGLAASGIIAGIATNDGEAPARAHLEQYRIAERFAFVAGYDSGFGAKPAPGMCLAFADHVGVAPQRIVMVGDSLHDLQAGRAAGMVCVGVLTGVAGPADLAPFADEVLAHIGELPDWLAAA